MSKGKLGYFNPKKPQEGRITDIGPNHYRPDAASCYQEELREMGFHTGYWSPVSWCMFPRQVKRLLP